MPASPPFLTVDPEGGAAPIPRVGHFARFTSTAFQTSIRLDGCNGGTAPSSTSPSPIYDDRRFQDLPILVDALEEAGCANVDILGHCRGPGPHARGCWVVDLILGKE
jgi:hypothetical protein